MNEYQTYIINERQIEPEVSLALYQTVLQWASARGSSFVISINKALYPQPETLERLLILGQLVVSPELSQKTIKRKLAELFSGPLEIVQVSGKPSEDFVYELTRTSAPPGAISGDVSPVEDVVIFHGDRRVYASYDYGRTQVLELTGEELENLKQSLVNTGLDPARIILAPSQTGI